MKIKISPDRNGLGEALEFVEKKLTAYKLDRKDITKNILATEEVESVSVVFVADFNKVCRAALFDGKAHILKKW